MQHMNRRERRRIAYGAAAGAVLLSTASVAYACTIFMGQMTVTGNGKGPDGKKSSVTVVGNTEGMQYCNSPSQPLSGRAVSDGTGYTYLDSTRPGGQPALLDLSLAPYVDPRDPGPYADPDHPDLLDIDGCTGQLPDRVYNVNFFNGAGFITTRTTAPGLRAWNRDCMYYDGQYPDTVGNGVKHLGTLTVANGVASGEFAVPGALTANTGTDESALCVSDIDQEGLYGLQAPVVVL